MRAHGLLRLLKLATLFELLPASPCRRLVLSAFCRSTLNLDINYYKGQPTFYCGSASHGSAPSSSWTGGIWLAGNTLQVTGGGYQSCFTDDRICIPYSTTPTAAR